MTAQLYYGCNNEFCVCYSHGTSKCPCDCYACVGAKKADKKREEDELKEKK